MVVTVTHGSHSGCTVTVLLVVTAVTVIVTVAWLAGIAARVTVSLSTTTTVTVTRSRSQPDWVLSLTWRLVVTQAGPARARYYTVALTWISRSSWSWQSWRPTSNWKIRTRGQLEGHGRNLFLGSVGYHLYLILSIIRSNCSSLKSRQGSNRSKGYCAHMISTNFLSICIKHPSPHADDWCWEFNAFSRVWPIYRTLSKTSRRFEQSYPLQQSLKGAFQPMCGYFTN